VEDIASRRDVAPADLPLNDLSLSREDSDKYTALTGIPPALLRFRVAVMQVLNERLAKMLSFIDFVEEEDVATGEVSAGAAAAAAAFDSRFVPRASYISHGFFQDCGMTTCVWRVVWLAAGAWVQKSERSATACS
jgi:hypothetical protein